MKEKKEQSYVKFNVRKIAIVFLSVLIVVAGLYLVGKYIRVPYTASETYYETVPTNKVETYYAEEPYTEEVCENEELAYKVQWGSADDECIDYDCASYSQICIEYGKRDGSCKEWNFWGTECKEYYQVRGDCIRWEEECNSQKCVEYSHTCEIIMTNLDTSGGYFEMTGQIKDSNDNVIHEKDLRYWISRGEHRTFRWTHTRYSGRVSCDVTDIEIPTKKVCDNIIKHKRVKKERTVVGEKKVLKTRKVVRYHCLFDHWGIPL